MSRMHVLCDEESLMTITMSYEELLQDPRHPIPSTTLLDDFLGESVDALYIDFPIAYDVMSSHQKLD